MTSLWWTNIRSLAISQEKGKWRRMFWTSQTSFRGSYNKDGNISRLGSGSGKRAIWSKMIAKFLSASTLRGWNPFSCNLQIPKRRLTFCASCSAFHINAIPSASILREQTAWWDLLSLMYARIPPYAQITCTTLCVPLAMSWNESVASSDTNDLIFV